MTVVWPVAYHSGINTGRNFNEAVNFGTRNWLEETKKHVPCECLEENTVIGFDLKEVEART